MPPLIGGQSSRQVREAPRRGHVRGLADLRAPPEPSSVVRSLLDLRAPEGHRDGRRE